MGGAILTYVNTLWGTKVALEDIIPGSIGVEDAGRYYVFASVKKQYGNKSFACMADARFGGERVYLAECLTLHGAKMKAEELFRQVRSWRAKIQ